MRITSFYLSLIAFLWTSPTFGQSRLRNISMTPQTPNVTAMAKYGDTPVGYYTGTAQINIPLYTIKIKDFEYPFSVSYGTSGIKVSEEAGPVGLGWALSAGGSISQIMNDGNDLGDLNSGGYINTVIPNHGTVPDDVHYPTTCHPEPFYIPNVNQVHGGLSGDKLFWNCVQDPTSPSVDVFGKSYDTEPDMFAYNFGAYSGKFFYNKTTAKFESIGRDKIKIEYTPSAPDDPNNANETSGWTIIGEDGIVYRFFKAEKHGGHSSPISAGGGGGAIQPDFNNYSLNSITLTSGEVINFSYTSPGKKVCQLVNVSEAWTSLVSQTGQSRTYTEDGTLHTYNGIGYSSSLSQNWYTPSFLDEVTFPGGRMKFSWASRSDIPFEQRLYRIEVFNVQDRLIREIDFDNDTYFIGVEATRPVFSYETTSCDCSAAGLSDSDVQLKRLKLESIDISDLERPYFFAYDESASLPAKMAFGSDYWGYWNGKTTAPTFLPDLLKLYAQLPYDIFTYDPSQVMGGAKQDRRADVSYTKAWTLKKVTYPTGGFTEYEYELNSFDNYDFASVDDVQEMSAYANMQFVSNAPNPPGVSGTSTMPFTINKAQTVRVEWKFPIRWDDNPLETQDFVAEVTTAAGASVFRSSLRITHVNDCTNGLRTSLLQLPAGNYVAKIYGVGNYQTCVHTGAVFDANATIEVFYRVFAPNPISRGAGLRIKSIKDNDGINSALTKQYQYTGGTLMDFPNFYRFTTIFKWEGLDGFLEPVMTDAIPKMEYTSNSAGGIAVGLQGNFVGYSSVKETYLDQQGGNNGYKIMNFHNSSFDCSPKTLAPCATRLENGLPYTVLYYNNQDRLVRSDSSVFTMVDEVNSYGLIGEASWFGASTYGSYYLHSYPINAMKYNLTSSFTKNYAVGQKIIERTDRSYNLNHYPSIETIYQSDGSTLINKIFYPNDNGSSAFPTMVAKNQIKVPIKTERSVTRNGVNTKNMLETWDYTLINGFGAMVAYNTSLDGAGTTQNEFTLSAFGTHQNPGEVVTRDGIHTTFRYDSYSNTTMKAVNATYSQVFYEGFNTANNTGKAGGYNSGLAYSVPFSIPDGNSYIIDYWYKTAGGDWVYKRDPYTGGYSGFPTNNIDEVRVYSSTAEVTTFTYMPLVGLTSTQDHNGVFTFYNYDSDNRLTSVMDQDGNILKSYKYHIK